MRHCSCLDSVGAYSFSRKGMHRKSRRAFPFDGERFLSGAQNALTDVIYYREMEYTVLKITFTLGSSAGIRDKVIHIDRAV